MARLRMTRTVEENAKQQIGKNGLRRVHPAQWVYGIERWLSGDRRLPRRLAARALREVLLRTDPIVRRRVHKVELLLPYTHELPSMVERHRFYDTVPTTLARFLADRRSTKLLIVDVGANVGDTTVQIAAELGNCATFICIEADPNYVPLLRANTVDLDVEIIAAIAGSVAGNQDVNFSRGGGTSSIIAEGNLRLPTVTIDRVLDGRSADLIKIDVDGYELEVLKGTSNTLHSTPRPFLFIEFSPFHLRE